MNIGVGGEATVKCWWGGHSETHTSGKEHIENLEPKTALLGKVSHFQTFLVAPPLPCTRNIQHEQWISDNMSGFF